MTTPSFDRLAGYLMAAATLPVDGTRGALAGRVWRPDLGGPAIVALRGENVIDVSHHTATMRDLAERADAVEMLTHAPGEVIGSIANLLANGHADKRSVNVAHFLAPNDLQAIKAAGVTFARSLLERVIEEQAKGAPEKAEAIRLTVETQLGGDLKRLKPGSKEALALKATLIAQGAWSQYLEVGIGEDAEIFTKAQPLSAVGHGAYAGLHPRSTWNNPEPEVVLVVSSRGEIVGATLGNDVNLRDFEGRSALLLSKAKDNTASAAIGPFVRFFDGTFTLDTVCAMEVRLTVEGDDGFKLDGLSSMREIARDPADLVRELIGVNNQYPDGAMLYLGTMFAPSEDRGAKGLGFTHKPGDVVSIYSAELGRLTNIMTTSDKAPRWASGVADLMRNLAQRKLI